MKTLILVAAIFVTSIMMFAANEKAPVSATATTSLTGQVVDKTTGEALAGVKIALNESEIIVYTDLDGNFEISNVKVGNHNIKTNLISYGALSVDVECNSGANDIEIELDNK